MYVVAECTTMSAPSASGRCSAGDRKGLSTPQRAPTARAAWAARRAPRVYRMKHSCADSGWVQDFLQQRADLRVLLQERIVAIARVDHVKRGWRAAAALQLADVGEWHDAVGNDAD